MFRIITKDSVSPVPLFSLLIHKYEISGTIFPEGIHSLENFEKLHEHKKRHAQSIHRL